MAYRRIATIHCVEQFGEYLRQIGVELPMDASPLSASEGSPLAQPMDIGGFVVGNRWAIAPMEGWDATREGRPTERTFRRWSHFGMSGAKLVWGGEAVAVRHEGRANPNQLCYRPGRLPDLMALRETLMEAHCQRFGAAAGEDLLVGLQLTHSGRYSCPDSHGEGRPRIAWFHPSLDSRVGIADGDQSVVLTDDEIEGLIGDYVECAKAARQAGFGFVDVKACHGYLGHEFLSAFERPGPYGGDFEGRTRFLREIVGRVRSECPGLKIGIRLSLFDAPPQASEAGERPGGFRGFGCDRDAPATPDPAEPIRLLRGLRQQAGLDLVNLTAGSPYYSPHIQRPAYYPPSDGYAPPEDPLIGCARQIHATRAVKLALPDLPMVGSAYSYLQEYLPHVAQGVVRHGWADFVGLGRMVLSYWDLPADLLEGRGLNGKRFCRTFSDCTTAARNGLPSGCYPLDPYYKKSAEAVMLRVVKGGSRALPVLATAGQ